MNGFQVFGRHNVLVVYIQFHIRFLVAHRIRAAAYLHTGSPVGRMVHLVQRKIALARYRHAQSAVAEHLDTYPLTARSADILFTDMTVNFRHLLQIQFARQHHHIGKLGIETQSLHIRNIQLRGQMHLLSYLPGVAHHSHIGCNHRRDTCRFCRIHNGSHQGDIVIVDNGIYRKVTFHTMLITGLGNLPQIVNGKGIGGTGTHIQVFDTEVNRVRTRLDSCGKRLARAYRSHDFKIVQSSRIHPI